MRNGNEAAGVGNLVSAEAADRYMQIFEAVPSLAYSEGITLFKQGAAVQNVYRLDKGLVKIMFLNPAGEEVIIHLCADAGAVFGDVCAILGRQSVSAHVVTRDTQLRRVPARLFIELVSHDTEMSWSLHQDHCRMLNQQIERAAQLGYLSVRQRIENLLWKLASVCESTPTSKGLRMQLPLKYRELAQLVAVSPEHLCRVLGVIEKERLILRDKGWLYLTDLDLLWRADAVASKLAGNQIVKASPQLRRR